MICRLHYLLELSNCGGILQIVTDDEIMIREGGERYLSYHCQRLISLGLHHISSKGSVAKLILNNKIFIFPTVS